MDKITHQVRVEHWDEIRNEFINKGKDVIVDVFLFTDRFETKKKSS